MQWFKFLFFIVVAMCCFIFTVNSSVFECNQKSCAVTNKNIMGMTRSKYRVDLSSIKGFEYRKQSCSRSTPGRRGRYGYYIYANLQNGSSYKFFLHSSGYEDKALDTVNKLNKVLKDKSSNIYINY